MLRYRRLRYGYPFRRIKLTQGKYAIVDPEDYERLNKHKWQINRGRRTLYAVRAVRLGKGMKQKKIKMHREILKINDSRYADHINHNGLDNLKVNLRPATPSQNRWNSKKRKGKCSSKYIGVSWYTSQKKWAARIMTNRQTRFIGYFDSEIDAAKAYDRVARIYRGQYACLNFESPPTLPASPPTRGPI